MSRSPFSEDRLHITKSGNVRIKLKGTTHIEITPLEFMEKLAALIPLPKSHTVRYFGVFPQILNIEINLFLIIILKAQKLQGK